MKKNKTFRFVLICLLSIILFLALSIPTRKYLNVLYVTEVRPSAVLNPVLGIIFGLPAIIGCTLGNFALDMIWGATSFSNALLFMIPQFFYGFIPCVLWKKWNKKERKINSIYNISRVLRFIAVTTIGALQLSLIAGIELGIFTGSKAIAIEFSIFSFINNVLVNSLFGIPLMIIINRIVSKDKLEYCERLLLVAGLIEVVASTVIVVAIIALNPDRSVNDAKFWDNIYIVLLFVIFILIVASIIVIAIRLQNKLGEKEHELNIAATIQNGMLPKDFNQSKDNRYEVYASMIPAKEIGGDFYDFFMIDDNHFAFVIADVSGKGISAALFMMRASQVIRNYAKLNMEVDQVLFNANNALAEYNKEHYFVTAWIGVLDLNTGEVSFANAGHNNPVIIKNNKPEYLSMDSGIMLGARKNINFKIERFFISEGDMVFAYTDGVVEGKNKAGEMFKESRLLDSINDAEKIPSKTCEKVFDDLNNFTYRCEQFDDITMIAVKYNGPKA